MKPESGLFFLFFSVVARVNSQAAVHHRPATKVSLNRRWPKTLPLFCGLIITNEGAGVTAN